MLASLTQPFASRADTTRSETSSADGANNEDPTNRRPGLWQHSEGDLWQPGSLSIPLEAEFYTAAFVSPLHLHQQRHFYERVCGEGFFTFGMLCVGLMQCLTVFGMSSYLNEKSAGYTDEFKLGTGLFTTGGATMSMDQSRDLCGKFSEIGLKSFAGVDSLKMPDGTRFEGSLPTVAESMASGKFMNTTAEAVPAFHSYKMPSGSWTFTSVGADESYIDKQLRVVHGANFRDSWSYLVDTRVEYGVLLVIMVGWLWYHCLYEMRKIFNFSLVLRHFYAKGLVSDSSKTTLLADDGTITITALTSNAFLVGSACIAMRITVSLMMLVWGTSLLAASWDKLSLVLNSLAIGIVFDLDGIIAYACIDHNTMQRIENIEPVTLSLPETWNSVRYMFDICLSIALLVGVFLAALSIRYWQLNTHMHQLHIAAALCLFAGTPPASQPEVLAPVPGFCESLLSMTCAPNVTGTGSHHGPCLITDQKVFQDQTVMMYGDEALFENMYDADGKRQSMAKWGQPKEKMLSSGIWQEDTQLNLFRRICTQLYQPEGNVDRRTVDTNIGLHANSAPFYCPRETIFDAVFGGVHKSHDGGKNFDQWSSSFDLNADGIVAALDRCHQPSKPAIASGHATLSSPAPAPSPADSRVPGSAPATAPVKFLRRHPHHRHPHHRRHEEVYHFKMEDGPKRWVPLQERPS